MPVDPSHATSVFEDEAIEPRRAHPRVGVSAGGSVSGPLGTLDGLVRNLSLGGALFTVPGEATMPAGTGIELALRLPSGERIRVPAVVRWTKPSTPAGWTSVGLQFPTLSGPNRSYVEHHVESVAASGIESNVRAEAHEKYRLAFDPSGRLRMSLGGLVTPEEAGAFRELLEGRLEARKPRRVHFQLDARALSVCCAGTMQQLKRCMETLASRESVFGLLIGPSSLAVVQLLRLARDAGMADSLFSVNESQEAEAIWAGMDAR